MTADVNFGLLRRLVDGVEGARPHGPVGQGQFLREMGIGARLTALAEQPHVTEEQVSRVLCVDLCKYVFFFSFFFFQNVFRSAGQSCEKCAFQGDFL